MARYGWCTLACLLLCQTGCVWNDEIVNRTWLKRFQDNTISPDHALVEVALLDCPPGDEFINHEIWKQTDELIVEGSGRRRALADNGFRIGQLVGPTPAGLQRLLLSNRSCTNAQAMIFPAGKTVPIHLSSEFPQTGYRLVDGDTNPEVTLDKARFCLDLTARFTSDEKTTLRFTPRIEHGEPIFPFQAAPERSTWELRVEKSAKKYPELSWDVTLDVNQYLIIGCWPERDKSIGQTALLQEDGRLAVQRLLVIRNCRAVTARDAHESSVEELVRRDKSPPLALQATIPATRAKNH